MTIEELIGWLKKATEPSRELDAHIYGLADGFSDIFYRDEDHAVFGKRAIPFPHEVVHYNTYPEYTASIDAALSLIPLAGRDANYWGIEKDWHGTCEAHVQRNGVKEGHWAQFADHSHPAIALCIAILKAKQAQEVPA
ncbi:hypothetical protein [Rhizobium sp.]|uniref:hypothetical protein n=1 Tax=Rhizobium sp. TaxID=391 RepID=UPI003F80FD9E